MVLAPASSCPGRWPRRSLGTDPTIVFPRLSDQDLKDRVRANTHELIARGGFGVPTFYLHETRPASDGG